MSDLENLETRITALEERIEFYDRIWLFASWIGLTIIVIWIFLIGVRLIGMIFS